MSSIEAVTPRPDRLDRLYVGSTGHGDPATCQTILDAGGPCRECDERAAVLEIERLSALTRREDA